MASHLISLHLIISHDIPPHPTASHHIPSHPTASAPPSPTLGRSGGGEFSRDSEGSLRGRRRRGARAGTAVGFGHRAAAVRAAGGTKQPAERRAGCSPPPRGPGGAPRPRVSGGRGARGGGAPPEGTEREGTRGGPRRRVRVPRPELPAGRAAVCELFFFLCLFVYLIVVFILPPCCRGKPALWWRGTERCRAARLAGTPAPRRPPPRARSTPEAGFCCLSRELNLSRVHVSGPKRGEVGRHLCKGGARLGVGVGSGWHPLRELCFG